MNNIFVKWSAIIVCSLCSTSCTHFWKAPQRVYAIEDEILALKKISAPPDFAKISNMNSDDRKKYRNVFVAERMYGIDLVYTEFFTKISRDRQAQNFGGHLVVNGLNVASTLSKLAATKTVYNALQGAVTKANTDFDNDILAAQTMQVLLNKMESGRLEIRQNILAGLKKIEDDYTLAAALSDLEDYYRAGTLAGALEELVADAGKKSSDAKAKAREVNQ